MHSHVAPLGFFLLHLVEALSDSVFVRTSVYDLKDLKRTFETLQRLTREAKVLAKEVEKRELTWRSREMVLYMGI